MSFSFKKWLTNFWTYVGLSIFLHIVFVSFKNYHPIPEYVKTEPTEKPIKLTFLLDNNKEPKKNSPAEKKQIVQSEEAKNNTQVDSKFLSDKDRKFERQTVSRNTDTFKSAAKGSVAAVGEEVKPSKNQKKGQRKNVVLSDLGQFSMGEENPIVASAKRGQAAAPIRPGSVSASNDYIKDITLGDFTQVNTQEYKFYGFYHRIKVKLEQFWGRSIQEKAKALHRSGRRLPASEDLITSLQVTLDAKGQIVRVKVLGTSGVRELDEAAIGSFNEAGPFPNPPKDLLVNGEATIEWGFVVKS